MYLKIVFYDSHQKEIGWHIVSTGKIVTMSPVIAKLGITYQIQEMEMK